METRLTERGLDGHAYFPTCFKEPCLGIGCQFDMCRFMRQVREKLARYEDQEMEWEQEAKKQAAAAGEMLIKIAERLEDIRTRISTTRQMLLMEDNHMDQAILQWKLRQLQEQEAWMESVLYGRQVNSNDGRTETGAAAQTGRSNET